MHEDLIDALLTIEEAVSRGYRVFRRPEASVSNLVQDEKQSQTGVSELMPDDIQPQSSVSNLVPDEGESTAAALENLAREVAACEKCVLAATRHNTVFGQGVLKPLVLVVGEGPGAEEDAQGLPFVGPSGKLLDKMLASIDLSRQTNCYIGNIVKCRPPNNREPSQDERASCMPYLRSQIALLKPRAILCAGRTAAQVLLGTADGINKLRGRTFEFEGIPLIATYHPSALLRDESLKRPAWEDLKRLRALLDALS